MAESITATAGILGGKPCVANHRIRVSDIVIWHEDQGMTADAIVSQVPGLTLVDVHLALAWYYENRDAIRDEIRAELVAADQYRTSAESILPARLSRAKRVS